jgi:aspartate dehydrogenase
MKINIGIVGCGTIGKRIIRELNKKYSSKIKTIYINDINPKKIKGIKKYNLPIPIIEIPLFSDLIKKSDFIIESASIKAAAKLLKPVLEKGKDVLIMSIGALVYEFKFYFELAKKNNAKLIIPSGAIGGIDAIKAITKAGIKEITLSTYKPILSLANLPFFRENNIEVNKIKEEKMVFEGSVEQAIEDFPQNINVAACLKIASLFDNLKVRIFVSPKLKVNRHEIKIKSKIGNYKFILENFPIKENPKTSALAIHSALVCIESYFQDYVRIGN